MRLKPLEDRIVVQRREAEKVSEGGIFIPENFAEKADSGTVLEVGPGKYKNGKFKTVDVTVGDTVMFARTAGQTVEVEKQEFLILREEDVLAIITVDQ